MGRVRIPRERGYRRGDDRPRRNEEGAPDSAARDAFTAPD